MAACGALSVDKASPAFAVHGAAGQKQAEVLAVCDSPSYVVQGHCYRLSRPHKGRGRLHRRGCIAGQLAVGALYPGECS